MARTLLLAATAVAAALPAAPAAAAPSVTAQLSECRPGATAMLRSVSVRGEMETVPKAARMAMRFDLFVREGTDARYLRIDAPGLGEWIRSERNVGRFIWTKQLTNLDVPADYRARVVFVWFDRAGDVVERAARRTDACRQPDERPNLSLGRPVLADGPQHDLVRYELAVGNDGKSEAPPFDVTLDGAAPTSVTGLRPGDVRTVGFVAPRCTPGQILRFEADPDDLVEESDESDNALRVLCPERGGLLRRR